MSLAIKLLQEITKIIKLIFNLGIWSSTLYLQVWQATREWSKETPLKNTYNNRRYRNYKYKLCDIIKIFYTHLVFVDRVFWSLTSILLPECRYRINKYTLTMNRWVNIFNFLIFYFIHHPCYILLIWFLKIQVGFYFYSIFHIITAITRLF